MKQIDNKTIGLIGAGILGLVIIYLVSAYAIPKAMVMMTKAAPATKVSLADSYLLGQKILARADGKDTNVVNVFVLDSSSKGVSGKRVSLEAAGVKITPEQGISDNDGKATFRLTADKEAVVEVTGLVEGLPLTKSLKVTFRK